MQDGVFKKTNLQKNCKINKSAGINQRISLLYTYAPKIMPTSVPI